ncbi:hypothetical protein LYSHEL_07010 [Lysobacter helvus]|uniref:Uncharacterized protein n=2 Tax=Lysobacteraceae TaxID=32033 RepID=A0ABN6FPW9_9GAMM|nr:MULTISPECIES: hypothetical protein [Lysobacter]BCT91677.1 hypothetical protein LYSCAS_07010 [Lysobacter caseinilyticus]BCT94830.1 hypothetical protein LYSHEL_07010 [Lysobacter helvus]
MPQRIARRLRNHDWIGALIELAIVVAGILIALQVSNWNQDRSDTRRKHAYLSRIVADLDTDLQVNGNRDRFLAQVRAYGEQALAHAETGALVEGSAWKTVLAYFQAGQFYAYSRESNTFAEMRDAGDLGLIAEPRVRSQLAFYYESNTNLLADSMIMNLVPQYRQDIRSVTPIPVQDYIWTHCFQLLPGSARDQRMVDCPAPIDEAHARAILASYAQFPELARELRFWLSSQRISSLTTPEDRRDATQLKARLEAELR